MTRTTTPNTGFIYGVDGVNSLVIASAGPDASEDSSAESDQAQSPKVYLANRHIKPDPPGIPLRRYQELLPLDMNPSDRFLLDHFVKLSSVFSLPTTTPHLMWSILALACRSCLSSGLSSIMGADTETMMLQFSSSSFRSLQQAISTSPENDSLVPTTLLLCLGEIYGGRTQSKSWIVHLKGARALMAVRDWSISEVANDQRESSLLWEMLTTSGEHFVDELLAFSTELIPILLSIGQLEQQPRQSRVPHGEDLLRKLNAMIERHERDPPPLRRALHASTPEVEAHQFALSSAAYHYATQIHIYRRLLDRPSESTEVQASVHNILHCAEQMVKGEGGRPWITMVMPLFTAGCEAHSPESRAAASGYLQGLEQLIGAQNIHHARSVMEKSWDLKMFAKDSSLMVPSIWSHTAESDSSFITF
ncbi:hypothetical protein ABEF91_007072 [Exophiala dermatitidis]